MTSKGSTSATLRELDDATRSLVRLSAIVTAGDEADIRAAMSKGQDEIPAAWVEELVLQTYLFAGFPRTLNAMREWRRIRPDPLPDDSVGGPVIWRAEGMDTCAAVYGDLYDRLRANIREIYSRIGVIKP